LRVREALDLHKTPLEPHRKRPGKNDPPTDAAGMWCPVSGTGQDHSPESISPFTSTTGGVMTDEVGAITGELELLTRSPDSGVEARVRYAGARDLYTVSGSPVPSTGTHQQSHENILEWLTTPGSVEGGNELPVDLTHARFGRLSGRA
jgi:hypothetical protein